MADPPMRAAAKETVMHHLLNSPSLSPYYGPYNQSNHSLIKQEFEYITAALTKRPSSPDRQTAWPTFITLLFKTPDIALGALRTALSRQKESVERREMSLMDAHKTYCRFMVGQLAEGGTVDGWVGSCERAVERVREETKDFEFGCVVVKVLEVLVGGLEFGGSEGREMCFGL